MFKKLVNTLEATFIAQYSRNYILKLVLIISPTSKRWSLPNETHGRNKAVQFYLSDYIQSNHLNTLDVTLFTYSS